MDAAVPDRRSPSPPAELAHDLDSFRELSALRQRLLTEARHAHDARDAEDWRRDAAELTRLVEFLIATTQKLQGECDALERERDHLFDERDALRDIRNALHEERDALRGERDSLREERDGLREELHAQERIVEMHDKFQELTAFAEQILTIPEAPPAAPQYARRFSSRAERPTSSYAPRAANQPRRAERIA